MTREIKFRAWDRHNQKMVMDCIIGGLTETVGLCPSRDNEGTIIGWVNLIGNEPVMQFTGLTDKNGKEIYEGDIIGWGSHHISHDIVEVKFVTKRNRTFFDLEPGSPRLSPCEVIGNIHESPELLKEATS